MYQLTAENVFVDKRNESILQGAANRGDLKKEQHEEKKRQCSNRRHAKQNVEQMENQLMQMQMADVEILTMIISLIILNVKSTYLQEKQSNDQ